MKVQVSFLVLATAALATLGLTACATTSSPVDIAQRRAAPEWGVEARQAATEWGQARMNQQMISEHFSAAQAQVQAQIQAQTMQMPTQ